MFADRACFLVGDELDSLHGHDFVVELAGLLGCGGTHLALQCILVLIFTADVVAFCDRLGSVNHRVVNRRLVLDEPRVVSSVAVLVVILYQAD